MTKLKTLKDIKSATNQYGERAWYEEELKEEATNLIKKDRKDAFELQKFIMKELGEYDKLEDYDIEHVLRWFFNIKEEDLK